MKHVPLFYRTTVSRRREPRCSSYSAGRSETEVHCALTIDGVTYDARRVWDNHLCPSMPTEKMVEEVTKELAEGTFAVLLSYCIKLEESYEALAKQVKGGK